MLELTANTFMNRCVGFLYNLFTREHDPVYELAIPSNIVYRTELICSYIRDEKGYDFELENFIMLLYLDFIKDCIKSYNPEKVLKLLTADYDHSSTIVISDGSNEWSYTRNKPKYDYISISIAQEDADKGQLILDELYDIYKQRFSFIQLIESIWIGFIEDYKNGTNKRAYYSIVKLLKECLE